MLTVIGALVLAGAPAKLCRGLGVHCQGSAAIAPKNSVAVLPFENLSGDPAQSYFSDGLTDEITGTLARSRVCR